MKKYPEYPVLLIDDEEFILEGQSSVLSSEGINNIICMKDATEVKNILQQQEIEVILLDLIMPQVSGQEILKFLSEYYPEIPVIVITGTNEVAEAVQCMKMGAYDYMVKVVEKSRLISGIKRAIEQRSLKRENRALRSSMKTVGLKNPGLFSKIITSDPGMIQIFNYIEVIASSPEPVLITGETGVGKELIAEALYSASGVDGPFISVNAAGIDDLSFSDTLFGHRKGAFTGAVDSRPGLIKQAAGGILFLDEIGELSQDSQIKLLRLIDKSEYYALGSDSRQKSEARIVAATNRDLEKQVAEGGFRKDLFYRLDTHSVALPPLRERPGDIQLLTRHFLPDLNDGIFDELCREIEGYSFPGNIRELKSILIDSVERSPSQTEIPEALRNRLSARRKDNTDVSGSFPTIKEAVERLVNDAMKKAGGNQTLAAGYLGITKQALNKRLSRQ